jgi:hypothetical protein
MESTLIFHKVCVIHAKLCYKIVLIYSMGDTDATAGSVPSNFT